MNLFALIPTRICRWLAKPQIPDLYVDLAVAAEDKTDIVTVLEEALDMQENSLSRVLVARLIRRYTRNGSLDASLAEVFGVVNQSLLHAMHTEENGLSLSDVFDFQGELLERRDLIKTAAKRVLVYPAIVIMVAFVIIATLLVFVVPQFNELFESFGAELPALTNLVIDVSNAFVAYWWIVVSGIGVLAILYRFQRFRAYSDRIKSGLPVLAEMYRSVALLQFLETLTAFTETRIQPFQKIKYSTLSISNDGIRSRVQTEVDRLPQGRGLATLLSELSIMPKRLKRRLTVKSAGGPISAEIEEIIQNESHRIAGKIDSMTTIVGTIASIMIAIVIGMFVIGMYLPIFKTAEVIT